ncbi:MAG: hypothetical protein RIS70_550 [Planctomycetota bacterium]
MLRRHLSPQEVLQHRHPRRPLQEENHPPLHQLVRAEVRHHRLPHRLVRAEVLRLPQRLLRPTAARRHQPLHQLDLTAVRHRQPPRLLVPEEVLHPARLRRHHPVLHPHPAAASPAIRHHPACRQVDLKSLLNLPPSTALLRKNHIQRAAKR